MTLSPLRKRRSLTKLVPEGGGTRFGGKLAMELKDEVSGIGQIGERKPKAIRGGVADEIHQVFVAPVAVTTIQNSGDFVLRVTCNEDRGGRGREAVGNSVGNVGGEEGHMKDRMDREGGGKGKLISMGADAALDRERPQLGMVELGTGTGGPDVAAIEPN
jgi:hypothetical protein